MLYRNTCSLALSLFIITSYCSMNNTRKHKLLITEAELKLLPAEMITYIFHTHLLENLTVLSSDSSFKEKKEAVFNLMLAHRCRLSKKKQQELIADIQYRLFQESQASDRFAEKFLNKCNAAEKKILEKVLQKVDTTLQLQDYLSHCSDYLNVFSPPYRINYPQQIRYPLKNSILYDTGKDWNIQFFEPLSDFKPVSARISTIKIQHTRLHELSFFGRFFSESAENIKKVKLEGNRITTIPVKEFNILYNIIDLSLAGNLIKDIPELLILNNLNTLNLEENNLTKLPSCAGLPFLTLLRASHNAIQEIEVDAFATCTHLKTIYLDNNRIKKFKTHALASLAQLYLDHNALEKIGEDMFGPHMTLLSVAGNPKLQLTENVFKNCKRCLPTILVNSNTLSSKQLPHVESRIYRTS